MSAWAGVWIMLGLMSFGSDVASAIRGAAVTIADVIRKNRP